MFTGVCMAGEREQDGGDHVSVHQDTEKACNSLLSIKYIVIGRYCRLHGIKSFWPKMGSTLFSRLIISKHARPANGR
jgi:hypothetical protein